MKKNLGLVAALFALCPVGFAELVSKTIEYKEGKTVLEGYYVYDNALSGKRPGVVVVHDWLGQSDFSKGKADALAKLGYAAFAADIYGKGVRPKDTTEASAQATLYKSNRSLLRARAQAALDTLKAQPHTNPARLAAIGFCFGGTTVLELARSGASLLGVVSFHGGLDTPTPQDAKLIKGKVLALHGADDPYVPAKEVDAFESEMRNGKVDWQLVKYSGAVHSFTLPHAGNDNSKGAAYNANADRRSWVAMQNFFTEIFQ